MVTDGCGGKFLAPSGRFASPGYPESQYENFLYCEYVIESQQIANITITFLMFDLEDSGFGSCEMDYLEVLTA